MSTKIKEIIIEPSPVNVSSTFKIKIKVQRGLTFKELKDNMTFSDAENYKFSDLKGD